MCSLSVEKLPLTSSNTPSPKLDMMHDDVLDVRRAAALELVPILRVTELRQSELPTVLSSLEDASAVMRAATHELLASISLGNPRALQMALQGLLHALGRYPGDQNNALGRSTRWRGQA